MHVKEKILLVQLLLIDVRCNWGWENTGNDDCSRVTKAKELCEELANGLEDDRYLILASCCDEYIRNYYYDGDGRYFRDSFPYGYEYMDILHGLESTYADKSDEFKMIVNKYITYPDSRFDDWEDKFKG